MKKLLVFTSMLASLIYLSSAVDIVLNSGEKLESSNWNNLSSMLNKVDVSGDNLSVNGKLAVNGKICLEDGSCLGECGAGYNWDNVVGCIKDFTLFVVSGKLQASNKNVEDFFGRKLSISSDGNTIIIGAPYSDVGGLDKGAVYIFVRNGNSWEQQAQLQSNDIETEDYFGNSVSINLDGTMVVIGANGEDTGGSRAGSAYVFTRSGSSWSQQAKLEHSAKTADDYFGTSVGINGDGTVVVVGANGQDTGASRAGSAYVFTRSGSNWSQQAQLQASDRAADDFFGMPVSINLDGTIIVSGAHGEDTGGNAAGSAYVFTRSGNSWSQQAKLQASDKQADDYFGYSANISGDGNTIVVGSYSENTGGNAAGSAYVFTSSGNSWSEQAQLQANDKQAESFFGFSANINKDGNVIVIGASEDDHYAKNTGSAYVFTCNGNIWEQKSKLEANDKEEEDRFGYSSAIDGIGSVILVGAHGEDTGGSGVGAAYIFE